ncbi:MAG: Asp-tRNA(Asn)/Glu-tRNA(Gln) amidotransferase subunit GatA [Patescibacteria group bacterium]|jgi:aspartyl-tRNA(Asn)/glutamyl-tRNA(Gln) amidotransferase subunit A
MKRPELSSAADLAARLKERKISSTEAVRACLEIAEAGQKTTNAYITLCSEDALAAAAESDKRFAQGAPLSGLDGIPVAIKDNILVAGQRATAGSAILKDYAAAYDATVIGKLKAAGAVIIGKTNMDEFAMGSSTESSHFGPTRNPRALGKIPGGSSGGSAAAVAEGSALLALGSDTGGSIRQPAAMCGVVGLKPTYGRVSRYGLMAMASSLDQIGPFANTVADAALLLAAIEGRDPHDSTSVVLKPEALLPPEITADVKGLKIGLPKEYFVSGMDPEVESAVRKAIEVLKERGAEIREVSLPHADYALAVYYILMPCEVSANLARFDGMRYGLRAAGPTLEETYRATRGQGFGQEVRRRIMFGTYALSSGYYDAYYLRAQKVRQLILRDFEKVFAEVDCLLTPTSPIPAWDLGAKTDDPLSMYLADVYTVSVNVAGLPAVSVPCGNTAAGLPVGLQIIGRHFDEATVLRAARAYEAATAIK